MMPNRSRRHRSLPFAFISASLFATLSAPARCQQFADASPTGATYSASTPTPTNASVPPTSVVIDRDVSMRKLPLNFLHDQKDIWLFPVHLAKGHAWLPTLGVVAVTGGLIVADPHDAGYFRRTNDFHGFNHAFDSLGAAGAIALVPVGFYAVGLLRHDSYAEKTGLFAGEAVADGVVLSLALRAITRRTQPIDIPPNGPFSDTFFQTKRSVLHSGGFPSMHAMGAMAVATVVARRYHNHRWVPFVAYGLAGAISFSRISRSDHFASDAFLGAALGYGIARFAVLHNE